MFFPSPGILFSEAVTPTPPLPYPETPCEQQRVKDEGVAVQVSQVWGGGIMLLIGEKAVSFLTKQSGLQGKSSRFSLSPLCSKQDFDKHTGSDWLWKQTTTIWGVT